MNFEALEWEIFLILNRTFDYHLPQQLIIDTEGLLDAFDFDMCSDLAFRAVGEAKSSLPIAMMRFCFRNGAKSEGRLLQESRGEESSGECGSRVGRPEEDRFFRHVWQQVETGLF